MPRKLLTGLIVLVLAAAGVTPAIAAPVTITVNSTGDVIADDDDCTFREALQNANNGNGAINDCEASTGGPDTIVFDINSPVGGAQTITVSTILAVTGNNVTVDGTTQPNCTVPCITLNGNSGGFDMLSVQGDEDTIKGLRLINANGGGTGLVIINADAAHIQDNAIGVAVDDLSAAPNSTGLTLNVATNAVVEHNVISGNSGNGIEFLGASTGNVIKGNKIGTNSAGDTAIQNVTGISMNGTSGNIIGGPLVADRNLISGNSLNGIVLLTGATATIQNNRIGSTANGVDPLPNGGGDPGNAGIAIMSNSVATVKDNLIGYQAADDYAILVSGGVSSFGTDSTNNCITGNPGGVSNATGSTVTFQENWWGDASGPTNATTNPGGAGDPVSNNVDFSGLPLVPPAACGFLYGTPPLPTSPKNGAAVLKGPTVKLAWKAVKNADGYWVQVDDNPEFSSPTTLSAGATNITTSALGYGVYYWRVAFIVDTVTSGYSSTFSFELTVNKTPAKNGLVSTHLPKFSWQGTTGATEYTLQVYDDFSDCESTTGPLIDKPGLTKTSYSMVSPTDTALNFGTYYWHVRASAGTTTAYAPCWPFDVSTLKSPKDNSIVANFLPKFSWGKNAAASGYTIAARKLNDDSTTTTVLNDFPVTLASYTALPGDGFTYGHYKWHITEVGSSFGNPTPDFEFFITNMSKPVNKAFVVDYTPAFSWKKVTGATAYTLQITTPDDLTFDHPVLSLPAGTLLKATATALEHGTYLWRVVVTGAPNYEMPAWEFTVGP